ncbi:unnamed protein product [Notodromas monacha]|uniref:Mitochondrial inner membrane protease ATP23 n=1 Tax=Notodromas monacha TaxID=399045 RepID=A0A7R9BLZ9_9CRUS|nr:unnamed protein product [Notodromas monacha]CAG0917967.1 unnamed protein product [Notodromas monacha]
MAAKQTEKEEDWGYDLYPERRGKSLPLIPSVSELLFGGGQHTSDKLKCEQRVVDVVTKQPLVRLFLDALRSSGCPIDIKRHIVCENCDVSVTGGYDPKMNQIVVCQNTCRSDSYVTGAIVHELVHMFDYCVNKLDFKNLDHLACTEIRAANLAHCSYVSAMLEGSIAAPAVKAQHAFCVQQKAYESVRNARRSVSHEEALAAVERVFSRCYNDLEPVGRRLRRGTKDVQLACEEGFLLGYT